MCKSISGQGFYENTKEKIEILTDFDDIAPVTKIVRALPGTITGKTLSFSDADIAAIIAKKPDFNPNSVEEIDEIVLNGYTLSLPEGAKQIKYYDIAGEIKAYIPGICFAAGTKVKIPEHEDQKIETIQKNTMVLSHNHTTGETATSRVTRVFKRTVKKLAKVVIAGTMLLSTPDHPFYANGAYTPAQDLTVGDSVLTATGNYAFVEQVSLKDTVAAVYNIEVEGNHNYFVGEQGVLVHNDCAPDNDAGCHFTEIAKACKNSGVEGLDGKVKQLFRFTLDEIGVEAIESRRTFNKAIKDLGDNNTIAKFVDDFGGDAEKLKYFKEDLERVKAWQTVSNLNTRTNINFIEKTKKVLNNKQLVDFGLNEKTLQELIEERLVDGLNDSDEDFIKMIESMISPNQEAKLIIGELFGKYDILCFRYFFEYSTFTKKAGSRISEISIDINGIIKEFDVKPAKWMEAEGKEAYFALLDKGKGINGYKIAIDEYALARTRDIGFALDKGLDALSDKGVLVYLVDYGRKEPIFINVGFCKNLDYNKEWYEIFFQTISLVRTNNRKIHFNLEGINPDLIMIWKDPNIIKKKDKIFSYTNFEIRQIVRNKDWFNNTIWYDGDKVLSKNELKEKFNIFPLFK